MSSRASKTQVKQESDSEMSGAESDDDAELVTAVQQMSMSKHRAKAAARAKDKAAAKAGTLDGKCFHMTLDGNRCSRNREGDMLFCGQHIQKQIELGATDKQLCYRKGKTFRLTEFRVDLPFGGQKQERGSLTQEIACGRAHEMICNSVSAELDVARRPKPIKETALVAKLRTLNALTDLTFIVDSGASRDAVPT